jgi:DNA modification methylase
MAAMPAESVQCVVTSPPYWGLRDYGIAGQLGLEPSSDGYIEALVGVFREVRRVLRSDGTVWLNMGDSYNAYYANQYATGLSAHNQHARQKVDSGAGLRAAGLKPKDLCMVPARLALALQADGWWLRSEIVWSKPNPMPESVTDRPTSAHEKVFLLSKSARYFYDADAVREAGKDWSRGGPGTGIVPTKHYHPDNGGNDGLSTLAQRYKDGTQCSGRNLRNVWHIATHAFSEAHFATFPPALVEPCIKAGCSEGGTVLDPFGGSGTVGLVADRLGRNAILIDLNPEYCAMARQRIHDDAPMFAQVSA